MLSPAMFSSKTDVWETPQELFDRLDAQYHFDVDVCALPENAKCRRFYTPAEDGLKQEWRGICWMNPPYGREIGKWVQKAYESTRANGATVVCLLPSRSDTAWFHDYVLPHARIEFLRGRLKFGGSKNSAPFPSVIAVLNHEKELRRREM